MQSIAALTTTFTPASSCLGDTNIWLVYDVEFRNCFLTNSFCSYYFLQGPLSTSACLPPSYGGSENTFYYPGICPSGYTSACTSVQSLGTYSVTVQICCPIRFVFLPPHLYNRNYVHPLVNTASGFQCQSNRNLYWQTTLGCFAPFRTLETIYVTATQSNMHTTALTTATVGKNDAVNAYAIAIQISVPSTTKANLPRFLS
jgi:hypothetical protein